MFDTKCYELATYFLADIQGVSAVHEDELAQTIQDAIEDWINASGLEEESDAPQKE
jgi:hypothetical protein